LLFFIFQTTAYPPLPSRASFENPSGHRLPNFTSSESVSYQVGFLFKDAVLSQGFYSHITDGFLFELLIQTDS